MSIIDFNTYAQRIGSDSNVQFMLPVIEKELLHYEIVNALEEKGLLSELVFQGGTCLRLCYGAVRFSEDLDFAGGVDFDADKLDELSNCIRLALPQRYSIEVDVKEPIEDGTLIKKWIIRIKTNPQRSDLPIQKISFEVASIPAYTKQPRMLHLNYNGLPSTFADIIVFAESLEEILADKLEAFVCSNHIRYRDIWDMYWIMRQPGVDVEAAYALREKKERDYREAGKFKSGLVRITEQLDLIINGKEFNAQMKRFLPADQHEKTIGRKEFRMLLSANIKKLYEVYTTR